MVSRRLQIIIIFTTLTGLVTIMQPAAANQLQNTTPLQSPIPEPDMPTWTEQPQNQTVEYGEGFSYRVNISGGVGYWWFVSDTTHFRISALPASDYADIHSIGKLAIGVYFLRITVWDQSYDNLQADIWISVADTIYPEIEGSEDIQFTEGERDHNLTWVAYDANPYSYVITKNGGSIDEGYWLESLHVFTTSLGFLHSGTYVYKLTVWDEGNNSIASSVLVHVRQNATAQSNTTQEHYVRTGEGDKYYYVPAPDIQFIEIFAIVVLSGLTGLVMISAVATKKHEFGFD